MSLFQRLWQRIRNPRGYIGRDLEGNRYFEVPNPNDAWGRPKRIVKYREGFDMWTYIAGERRLPVQWTSWLTHTRIYPPSLEELAADLERQKRVQLRAAMIEARDQEEMAQITASTSMAMASMHVNAPTSVTGYHPSPASQNGGKAEASVESARESPLSPPRPPVPSAVAARLPDRPPTSDEPQAWTPRAVQRGA